MNEEETRLWILFHEQTVISEQELVKELSEVKRKLRKARSILFFTSWFSYVWILSIGFFYVLLGGNATVACTIFAIAILYFYAHMLLDYVLGKYGSGF